MCACVCVSQINKPVPETWYKVIFLISQQTSEPVELLEQRPKGKAAADKQEVTAGRAACGGHQSAAGGGCSWSRLHSEERSQNRTSGSTSFTSCLLKANENHKSCYSKSFPVKRKTTREQPGEDRADPWIDQPEESSARRRRTVTTTRTHGQGRGGNV